MPNVQDGRACNTQLLAGKQAIGIPKQPKVDAPMEGCVQKDNRHKLSNKG
jgi:hypothetical protein